MRNCPACGFDGADLPELDYHKAHRAQHLARFPRSSAETIAALDRLVEGAERRASNPSPEAA